MKKLLAAILLTALMPIYANAAIVATNALTLQSVATTTANGITNAFAGISLPVRTYLIQNTGVPGLTNATFLVSIQASLDGVNWTTVSTYTNSSTNATVDTYSPNLNSITGYTRVIATTTNTVTIGVTSVRQ